ncbi:MAG: AAA family ATPase, partial [Clostridia bacterium]|nr:AAA family ATPase [Clostridia bacterium]
RRPYCVVLFDEIEKAHPDVFNVLLQLLDDGRLTDSQGHTVDFANTIIIMTSNLGSDVILNGIEEDGQLSDEAKEETDELLRSSFRPEFLNRLDEIIYFKGLTREQVTDIAQLMIDDVNRRVSDKGISVVLTDNALDKVISEAYSPEFGARPLRRYIQRNIETLLAKAMLKGDIAQDETAVIDANEKGLFVARTACE